MLMKAASAEAILSCMWQPVPHVGASKMQLSSRRWVVVLHCLSEACLKLQVATDVIMPRAACGTEPV